MSQSIRICSGLGPIIQQHIPNSTSSSSSSCMFLSTEQHTCMEVGLTITNLSSVKECRRKRAAGISMVSNRNGRLPFLLPCAGIMTSNVDDDEGGTSSSGSISKGSKYDPPKVTGISQVWRTLLSKFDSTCRPPQVTKEVVVLMIRMGRHDPIDGLKVLLDASRAWRRILSITSDQLYDAKEFDDHYGKSYLRKARMKGDTNKGKHKMVKNPPSRLTTKLSIIRLLADLHDPNDGLEVLLGALELWRTVFSSNELNDSEGYLKKEIFAIRNLSRRISVSNCNGKHALAKNPPSQTTYLLALFKLMIDNFKDPSDALKAMWEAFRCYDEGVECDGTSGLLVAAVSKLNFDD